MFDAEGYKKKAGYGYDAFGRLVWSEDALLHRTQYQYDNWSRQTAAIAPDGSVSATAYDDALRTVTQTDAGQNAWVHTYDRLDQLKKIEGKTAYDGVLKPQVAYQYDPVSGQVVAQTDAKGNLTQWTYHLRGPLASVTNAKQLHL